MYGVMEHMGTKYVCTNGKCRIFGDFVPISPIK